MPAPTTGAAAIVRLERTIAAPPERVFEAFTQASTLSRWFAPSPDAGCIVHELDARPGGRYRVEMRKPDGTTHIVKGAYEAVEHPTRLAFSWTWENNPAFGVSRVTVHFEQIGNGTRLVLLHEQLPTAEAREAHTMGWIGCLDRLVQLH